MAMLAYVVRAMGGAIKPGPGRSIAIYAQMVNNEAL